VIVIPSKQTLISLSKPGIDMPGFLPLPSEEHKTPLIIRTHHFDESSGRKDY